MARRQLLSNEAWSARLAPAVDDREVIRHYTLSEDDFDGIMRKRLDASRLGYALALCLMRHPGRSLEPKFGGLRHLGLRRIAHYHGHDARFLEFFRSPAG